MEDITNLNNKLYNLDKFCKSIYSNLIDSHSLSFFVYQEKYEEAIDFLSSNKKIELFPFLYEEYLITKTDPEKIANDILNDKIKWVSKISKIEALRRKYIKLINLANSDDEINQLYNEIVEKIRRIL